MGSYPRKLSLEGPEAQLAPLRDREHTEQANKVPVPGRPSSAPSDLTTPQATPVGELETREGEAWGPVSNLLSLLHCSGGCGPTGATPATVFLVYKWVQ